MGANISLSKLILLTLFAVLTFLAEKDRPLGVPITLIIMGVVFLIVFWPRFLGVWASIGVFLLLLVTQLPYRSEVGLVSALSALAAVCAYASVKVVMAIAALAGHKGIFK